MVRYGADERLVSLSQSFPGLILARVTAQHRNRYAIMTDSGPFAAEVSGKLMHLAASGEGYPAVGDFVLVRAPEADGPAVIAQTLPRKSAFVRKAAGSAHGTQVVAANIDVAFLCMSLNENYNESRLERYLAVAWESGATPVVLLTKADLCPDPQGALARVGALAAGAEALALSVREEGARSELLRRVPAGATAVFLGSSGVGKSSLINLLTGEADMATSAIRADGKGRHTTTHRQLLAVPGGGVVIDTPGMRTLGVEAADLEASFADIEALAESCRFRDCRHRDEPDCAVREALESGVLTARRLESYRKLQRETAGDGLSARKREERKIGFLFGGKRAMKRMMDEAERKNGRP